MFPIPWNKLFRKKDGSIVTIDEAISSGGGGGYTLPTASAEVKGGVKIGSGLTMDGDVLSADGGGGYVLPTASASTKGGVKVGPGLKMTGEVLARSDYIAPAYGSAARPLFKDASVSGKYLTTTVMTDIRANPNNPSFNQYIDYDLDEVYLPASADAFEFFQPINAALITALSLDTLYDGTSSGTSVETSASILDYDAIVLKGCYNSNGDPNGFDTTMLYTALEVGTPYWFGVKDRNDSYSGIITFTDGTHATLSASRTIKIYGYKIPSNSRKKNKK